MFFVLISVRWCESFTLPNTDQEETNPQYAENHQQKIEYGLGFFPQFFPRHPNLE
jgi:hypothetical protein